MNEPWHILGAGSLGCLWAARLQQHVDTRLILRNKAQLKAFQKHASIQLFDSPLAAEPSVHEVKAELATAKEPITKLLLCTKAYDALDAIKSVAHRFTAQTQIVLLQNGVASQAAIAQLLPKVRLIACATTEGAYLKEPYAVVWAGHGLTRLGDFGQPKAQPEWLQEWQTAGIQYEWTDDIETTLWRKLAINCIVNSLTALNECSNGELTRPQNMVNLLAYDLQDLMIAAKQPQAAADLHKVVWQVIHDTARNQSSMLQDIKRGNRTEMQYMIGYAYEKAKQLDVEMPVVRKIYQQLCEKLDSLGLPVN